MLQPTSRQFAICDLPSLLRFDGRFEPNLLQFTELDRASASFGASFYLAQDCQLPAIVARREEKRVQFANG